MERSKWLLFIIVSVAVIMRLIHVDQPFVDPWSWRQCDVAAIARNYLENGFHFGRPQIDWAGNEPGYVGTEFPILPFAAAFTYKITGVHEWVGRIQSLFCFAVALPFFFLFVQRVFGQVAAIWATFFYAFAPLSVVASRVFMPDMPSLSLAIIGMYFSLRWLDENDWPAFLVSALLISLAILIKLPNAIVGLPLLYLGRDAVRQLPDGVPTTKRILARWDLWAFAAIAFVPSAIWYWHAHWISKTFYPYHFFGGGGFRVMPIAWYWKIARETTVSSLTPILSALALLGVFVAPRGKYRRVFHWWLIAVVLFILAVGWGNRHRWYQLPVVPIAAAFAGCACQWIAAQFRFHRLILVGASVLLAVLFAISSHRCLRPFFRSPAAGLRHLGLELMEATTPNALIIAADDGDPTAFYYAHRKGWHFLGDGVYDGNPLDSAQIIANLKRLRERGATHLVFYEGTQWWLKYYPEFAEHLKTSATLVEETREFTIYKLEANQGAAVSEPLF
jgi:4-amino-4-deoxy-L-arabinose transferase-like glycosyltransferase